MSARLSIRAPRRIGPTPVPKNPNQPTFGDLEPGFAVGDAQSRAAELDELAFLFLQRNPWFWKLFVRFSHDAARAPHRGKPGGVAFGAKAIVERIRWEYLLRESLFEKHDYAVNNTLTASIARIYTHTYPEHDGLFETRSRARSEQAVAHGGVA